MANPSPPATSNRPCERYNTVKPILSVPSAILIRVSVGTDFTAGCNECLLKHQSPNSQVTPVPKFTSNTCSFQVSVAHAKSPSIGLEYPFLFQSHTHTHACTHTHAHTRMHTHTHTHTHTQTILTVMVPTDFGKRTGRSVKVAVMNIAVPTPSVILSKMQKKMNTQPEGIMSTNLTVDKQKNASRKALRFFGTPTERLTLAI